MPRVAIENLKLLDFDEIVCLIGQSLEDIYNFLLKTPYRDEILNLCGNKIESSLLEEALLQNYENTFNRLLKYSSNYTKDLLLATLYRFDALNLKTLFRMVHKGIDPEVILPHIIPIGFYHREKCEEILSKFNTVIEIINSIQDGDFGSTLKENIKKTKKIYDLSPLEAAIDREVFTRMLKVIKSLKRRDRKIATKILGIEIDALNVKIILKYKSLASDYEDIEEKLMPTVLIQKEVLMSAINENDIKSALQYLLKAIEGKHEVYLNIFTRLVEESNSSVSRLEFILDRAPLEMSVFVLKKNFRYYNIGFILSYLYMKWVEIRNLRSIINAVARNVGDDQINELLILPT